MSLSDVDEIINASEFVKPLVEYDRRLMPLLKCFRRNPLWFNNLHKLINRQMTLPSSPFKTMRCRVFKNNNSEHQYLVILPNSCCEIELNVFIVIDNGLKSEERGVARTANPSITIVFKRDVVGSEEFHRLIESVGNILCFHSWRLITITNTKVSKIRLFFKKLFNM